MGRKSGRTFKQSGVIPYQVTNGKIEVLLVTTCRSQGWVIPKSSIKKAMTPADSAANEGCEEAGVVGEVDSNHLAVETVLDDWSEASHRQRQWLELSQAVKQVKKASLKRILKTSSNKKFA